MKPIIKPTKRAEDKPDNMPHKVTQSRTAVLQKTQVSPKSAKQNRFLQMYPSLDFNITKTCQAINVGRRTFYDWKEDPTFLAQLKIAEDEKIETISSVLFKKAKAGDTISMIFWLKCVAHWNDQPNKHQIEISQGPAFDQDQLDAMVRGRLTDRAKYEDMLGLLHPSDN